MIEGSLKFKLDVAKTQHLLYRTRCYSKVMFVWGQFIKEQRLKKKKYELAVVHNNKNIVPRFEMLIP